MKLDLNAAWDQAIRLIGMNREVVLVLAGVFFFLPFVLFSLLIPMPDFAAVAGPSGNNSTALMAAVEGFVREYWWALLLMTLVQIVGSIAVMAVLGDPSRPTVGGAISRGLRFLPTSVGAQLILSVILTVAIFLLLMIGALTRSGAVAATLGILSLPLILWIMTRFSLASPTIAIEESLNPVAAMRRSWKLTSGNGLRLAVFYLLLVIAFVVISQVIGLVVMVLAALPEEGFAEVIRALLSGLVSSVLILIGYAVLASVHRQLARAERVSVPWTAN